MTLLSTNPSQGSYNNATNVWTVGNLDVDQTESLELEVRVDDISGDLTNVAEVTDHDQKDKDSDPDNDDGDQSEDEEDPETLTPLDEI